MTLSQIQPLTTRRFSISNVEKENPICSKSSVVQAPSISTSSSHLTNGRRRRARLAGFPSSPVIAAQNAASLRNARTPITSVREAIEGRARLLAVPAGEDVKKYTRSKVVLPRRLPRPHFRDIDSSRLATINADLVGIPIDYLQDNLATVGPQLLSVLAGAVPDRPQSSLPTELPVLIQDNTFDMPTHVFAVHGSGPPSKRQRKVTLFPAHNLVFAAHCAALPELPPSKPSQPEEPNTKITVPVVPLCIPSPAMFPTLQSYLYTKRSDLLLASLLPLPPHPDAPSVKTALDNLAKRLAGTFTLPALLERAQRVHGLWQNACALQIFDEKLFSTMEISWAVITNAMALATGQALGLPSEEDAMDAA